MIARYRVKSIRLASLAKFGCLLGGALAFVPKPFLPDQVTDAVRRSLAVSVPTSPGTGGAP